MKMVKLSAVIMMLLVILSSCTQPPIGNTSTTDVEQYLHFNKFVKESLYEYFNGVLPAAEVIDLTTAQYYYNYNCAMFGNPNFVIYIKNSFVEPELFEGELQRITTIAAQNIAISDNETLYIACNISEEAELYMDDKIQDGLTFRFEMAFVDLSANSIEYLSAWQCDENSKLELISRFVGYSTGDYLQ